MFILLLIFVAIIIYIIYSINRMKDGTRGMGCAAIAAALAFVIPVLTFIIFIFVFTYKRASYVFSCLTNGKYSLIGIKDWSSFILFGSLSFFIILGLFSYGGYKIKGRIPKSCKYIWRMLKIVILQPFLVLLLFLLTLISACVIYMRIAALTLDDLPLWGILIAFVIGSILFFAAVGLSSFYLLPKNNDFQPYTPEQNNYLYQKLKEGTTDIDKRRKSTVSVRSKGKGETL